MTIKLRYDLDLETLARRKCDDDLEFPEIMGFGRWLAPTTEAASPSSIEYELVCLLRHHGGSALRGHYSAVVKTDYGEW